MSCPAVPSEALPDDEARRLQALRELNLLDPGVEQVFDDLGALAAQVAGAPIALVSLVESARVWFKSRLGLDVRETPREGWFCAQAILGEGMLEVEDARRDPRFSGQALVRGAPHLRFYAGVPLRTGEGHALGTLCVLDRQPRRLEAAQREGLARLGRQAVRVIEARQAAARLVRAQQRLRRLADFRALLAEVSQAVADADDDLQLLRQACALGVRYAGARLMYVARPAADGRFVFLASAGQTEYLRHIVISSRADDPHGGGFAGVVWREGRALVSDDFLGSPELGPWREMAERYGFRAAATLPIRRGRETWAIMTIIDAQTAVYDQDLRELLEELSESLSSGLDRIDLAQRERESSALRDVLLDHSQAGIVGLRDGRLVRVNQRLVHMLGYDHAHQVLSLDPRDLVADEPEFLRWQQFHAELLERPLHGRNLRLRRRDGSELPCDVSGGVVEQQGPRTVVWTLLDISERVQLHRRLERALAYQRRLMEKNAAGMFTLDASGRIGDLNPALCEMLGYAREDLLGRAAEELFGAGPQSARFEAIAQQARQGQLRGRLEQRFRRHDGSSRVCEISGVPIELPEGEPGVLWSVIDVTALHEARDTIAFQARHDTLTGLPNRRALEQYLPRVLQRARRPGSRVVVGMLDLDDFKPVNDAHGHGAGDALLREFGRRLRDTLRGSDFLARFGGDEFVLVLEDLDEQELESQLDAVLARLHDAVEREFQLPQGQRVRVGMSLGLALVPAQAGGGEAVLRQADAALYELKAHKLQRARWWQLGTGGAGSDAAANFDPFGQLASEWLGTAAVRALLEPQACEQRLLAEWAQPEGSLGADRLRELAREQALHAQWLLGAQRTREEVQHHAGQRGRALALMGLEPSMLVRGAALVQQDLAERMRASAAMARTRHELAQIAEARLREDLQAQMLAHDQVVARYFAVFDQPAPAAGTPWRDALEALLRPVGELDGMLACVLMRPDSQGCFQVEAGAGPCAQAIGTDLREGSYQVRQDDDSPAGRGLVGSAWRSGRIQSTGEYGRDARLGLWQARMQAHGVRSVMAIPVPAQQEGAAFVLVLFGAGPEQFQARRMRHFARLLQQQAAQAWRTLRVPQPVAPPSREVAQAHRAALFRGGLELHMQPVVNLLDGSVRRVEALARLRAADASLVMPGVFLPLLGDAELDRLLRMVLEQSLGWLRRWDSQGLELEVSVNLAPNTLVHPQCAEWVAQALRASGVAPARLTLELLETQEIDRSAQARAIAALAELGVKLAIDDLGSGYSSLKRLTELPFDTIKVDQSLTLNLRRSPMLSFNLVGTLIRMGAELGRQVIVEGAQDADTVDAVRELGARLAQGYALARPMAAADLHAWWAGGGPRLGRERIHGPLGALALHWALAQDGTQASMHVDDCPVSAWLQRSGLRGRDIEAWHAAAHRAPAAWSSEQAFVRWLLGQLQSAEPGARDESETPGAA